MVCRFTGSHKQEILEFMLEKCERMKEKKRERERESGSEEKSSSSVTWWWRLERFMSSRLEIRCTRVHVLVRCRDIHSRVMQMVTVG